MELHVIECGGTINSCVDPFADSPFPLPTGSDVIEFIDNDRQRLGVAKLTHECVCFKDSRAMTDLDRRQLALALLRASQDGHRHILIPHGTWTMAETASRVKQLNESSTFAAAVVFVGSLVPLAQTKLPNAEARRNIEFAISALREAATRGGGVFVAMNNVAWDPDEVEKDPVTGEFRKKRRKNTTTVRSKL